MSSPPIDVDLDCVRGHLCVGKGVVAKWGDVVYGGPMDAPHTGWVKVACSSLESWDDGVYGWFMPMFVDGKTVLREVA